MPAGFCFMETGIQNALPAVCVCGDYGTHLRNHQDFSAASTASWVASVRTGSNPEAEIAVSGSLSP